MVLFYLSGSTNIFNFGNDAAFNPEVSGVHLKVTHT